ncbi:MAG TPA: tetratricopeptide repeat protein, partial [Thermodesulfobacteriota bacterium]|nr:tetratricopeptide repeat protein [Thermodesulfobacteriota bacterium]
LVRAGDLAGARQRYREALELAPDDVEARFGYARTSAWTGDYAAAEQAYREGLARAPASVDGLLGLADVLAWTRRFTEALELVAQAERLEPTNPEAPRRRGRFSRWRGDRAEAEAGYRRVLALVPDDEEASRALAELAAEAARTASTLEVAYTHERLSAGKAVRVGTGTTESASVQYTYAGLPRLTLQGRLAYSDRFGDREPDADDLQVTGGLAWRLRPRTTLRAELAGAPDADAFPAFAGEVELLQGFDLARRGGLVVGLGARLLDFNRVVRLDAAGNVQNVDPETTVVILIPSLEWTTPWPLVLAARLFYSISEFETIPPVPAFPSGLAGGTKRTTSGLLRATLFPTARVAPFVAVARGVESFATAQQLLGVTTDTVAAGAQLRLTDRLGLRASVEYQDSGRDTLGRAITQRNATAAVFVKW